MFYVHPHLWGLFLVPKCQFWLYLHIIIYTKKISRETFLDPRSSYMWRRCSFCCVWLAWYFELMCQVISIQYSNCLGSFDVLKSSPEVECVNAVTAGGSVKFLPAMSFFQKQHDLQYKWKCKIHFTLISSLKLLTYY